MAPVFSRVPAILGGAQIVREWLPKFQTYNERELTAALVQISCNHPMSGHLGGVHKGGYFVETLEEKFSDTFHVKHSVSVNSATSGLLAAAQAIELGPGDEFIVSPFTMSATAAAPAFLGATPVFVDVSPITCCIDHKQVECAITAKTRAIFATNLFGHPAELTILRKLADSRGLFLIEDNAQAPFAMEGKKFAGTVGHIGVFSFNVHKHLQCGEGGVCVTNDPVLAQRMKEFRNHGEMFDQGRIGLNLRMTETAAALAGCQLARAEEIISGRILQANLFVRGFNELTGLDMPVTRKDCVHVFYVVPFVFNKEIVGISRDTFMEALHHEFFQYRKPGDLNPISCGYVKPLYHLPAFKGLPHYCPVAEDMYANKLVYFENCTYSPTNRQMGQICKAFEKVIDAALDGKLKDKK